MTQPPLLPEHWQELIAGYALDNLSPEETEELEQLLATHPQLKAEIAQIQEVLALMPYGLPEKEPPAHLSSAILDTIASSGPAPRLNKRQFRWDRAIGIAAAALIGIAAAALIVALGINNYRLRQALQIDTRYATVSYSLEETKTPDAASATVVVNPNNLEAQLTVKNLPPLPPGKVYALWTVLKPDAPFTTDTKGAILTEVFNVDAQGNLSKTIIVPKVYRSQEWVIKVAVTVEDAASPQSHQGKPILIGTKG